MECVHCATWEVIDTSIHQDSRMCTKYIQMQQLGLWDLELESLLSGKVRTCSVLRKVVRRQLKYQQEERKRVPTRQNN